MVEIVLKRRIQGYHSCVLILQFENHVWRIVGGWRWPTCLSSTNDVMPYNFLKSGSVLTLPYARFLIPWIWLLKWVSIDPTRHTFSFILIFNLNPVWKPRRSISSTTRLIHWISLLTRFACDLMVHIFWLLFYFLILYFKCFKLQKIIENSFLTQKLWKKSKQYFEILSFWFLFFHNFIFRFNIFYGFSLLFDVFNYLKIFFDILKFWKNYGRIQWSFDKYWWPHFIFIYDFAIFFYHFCFISSFFLYI